MQIGTGGAANVPYGAGGLFGEAKRDDVAAAAVHYRAGGSLLAQPHSREVGCGPNELGAPYGALSIRAPPRLPKTGSEEGAAYFDPNAPERPPLPSYAAAFPPAQAPQVPSPRLAAMIEEAPPLPAADPANFPNLRRQAPIGGGAMDVL